MMRRRWFLALKWGSGKQKNSFDSEARAKKWEKYFITLERNTAALPNWGSGASSKR